MKPDYKKIFLVIVGIAVTALISAYAVTQIRLKLIFGDLPPYRGERLEYIGPGDEFTKTLPKAAVEKRTQELAGLKSKSTPIQKTTISGSRPAFSKSSLITTKVPATSGSMPLSLIPKYHWPILILEISTNTISKILPKRKQIT